MTLASTPDNPIPPGAIETTIRAADGVRLRGARWPASSPSRGTVAVLGGRGEFIEKYFELAGELLERGFEVVAMDWRGQGGSDRPLRNVLKGHVDDFEDYERDLAALADQVLAECPRPWTGLAHSMGAAVLLAADAAGHSPFDRLVLTSPMIAVKAIDHRGPLRYLVGTLDAVGLGGAFTPGYGARNLWHGPFEGNPLTSDSERFARIACVVQAAPELAIGGPTIGWAHAAFRALRRFEEPDFPRRAQSPILVVAAGRDRVTETAAAERFAARLRTGSIVVIDGAEHEILIERDVLRNQFWAAFDAFAPPPTTQPALEAAR
jgi:lysophospholipase